MGLDESSVSLSYESQAGPRLVDSLNLEQLREESALEQLLEAATSVCDLPAGVIALVDATHVHLLASVGVDWQRLPREHTLVNHVVEQGRPLVIEDASADPRWSALMPELGGEALCFYFGQPLSIDNSVVVGAMAVMDHEPRRISAHQRVVLASIARQVELLLEQRVRRDDAAEHSGLVESMATDRRADVRRQVLTNFLLHDVINAATAVKSDADYVRARLDDDATVGEALDDIAESVDVMATLLHTAREILLDAEATLVSRGRDVDLRQLLRDVHELHRPHLVHRGGRLSVRDTLTDEVISGDRRLLREMFESLLALSPPGSRIHIDLNELDGERVRIQYCDELDAAVEPPLGGVQGTEVPRGARDSLEALSLCTMIVEAHCGRMRMSERGANERCILIDLPR